MKLLKEFIKELGSSPNMDFNLVWKKGKQFFLLTKELKKIQDTIEDQAVSAGLFLGELVKTKFIPSPDLIILCAPTANNTIIIDEKSAWLFICGRDIFEESIIEKREQDKANKFHIVCNEKKEVIGIAKRKREKNKYTFLNEYDIGYLLRREQKRKSNKNNTKKNKKE